VNAAWWTSTAALALFFFLRGFVRGARANDLMGELQAAVRRWREGR
jgi:hypothetical protein